MSFRIAYGVGSALIGLAGAALAQTPSADALRDLDAELNRAAGSRCTWRAMRRYATGEQFLIDGGYTKF